MSSGKHLERTVGSLPGSNPHIEFTVGQVADYGDEDEMALLHITFSGVLDVILQDGLKPGKPSASEALVAAKLGDEEDVEAQPVISATRKAEQYLERLRSEAPGGTELLPARDASVKFWFDHEIVEKMLQRMNVQGQPDSVSLSGSPIEGAPYVTLFVDPNQIDDEKMLTADYDRVFEVTQYLSQNLQSNGEVEQDKIVHAAYQYWREATITNGVRMAQRDKEAYHIPELLAPGSFPPHAINRVLVPPELS